MPLGEPVEFARQERQPRVGFDLWRLPLALVRGFPWIVFGGLACAAAAFSIGFSTADFTAHARLIHNQAPALLNARLANETFQPREPSTDTVLEAIRSPELIHRVLASCGVTEPESDSHKRLTIAPAAQAEFIDFTFRDANADRSVKVVNRLAEEAVRISRELQADEFKELAGSLQDRLAAMDRDLVQAAQDLANFQRENGSIDLDREATGALQQQEDAEAKERESQAQLETLDLQIRSLLEEIARQNPTLIAARSALAKALERYTDEHPKVQQLRAALAAAEAEAAARGTNAGNEVLSWNSPSASALYQQVIEARTKKISLGRQLQELAATKKRLETSTASLPEKQLECARIKSRYQKLRTQRERLAQYEEDGQMLAQSNVGFYRLYQPARLEDLGRGSEWGAGWRWAGAGALGGVLAFGLLIVLLELSDGRIRSARDLMRISRLPLLATLGDLSRMSQPEKELWAFRTLALLKGKLNARNEQALVCGFISSAGGEGRSTWLRLLAEAATRQGDRVLVVSATGDGAAATSREAVHAEPDATPDPAGPEAPEDNGASRALVPQPAWPMAQGSLREGIWDPVKRQQWQGMLQKWDTLDQVVVLVELPPASAPEAILLAEKLPKVVWLCSKDMAMAAETRSQLETLRCSRCNLAGVVFNRANPPRWRRRFGHLVGVLALALGSASACAADAPDAPTALAPVPAVTNVPNPQATLSVSSPAQLADWQKRLTLGPGDVLEISLYEEADSLRPGLAIGPDGRLNYLEAHDVIASGLTVDELRKRIETMLAKYHRAPRVIVRPTAFLSKKYFVLGNVVQPGVFPLSRPVTLLEAVARSGGFVTSYASRNALVQADLPRSFLVRAETDGAYQRAAVDFEALFLQGNLTQNISLAPGDYLYFPPLDQQEVYVLGAVNGPGIVPFTSTTTLIGAIVTRGGFAEKAWRGKVLVVRGSLTKPQKIIVDANAILTARAKDFALQNKDIVYVSRHPFAKVEELGEQAVNSFVQAMVWGWTSSRVMPQLP